MTLVVGSTAVSAGTPISATLTIVNRTGHPVKVAGCAIDATLSVGIGNAKIPYEPGSGMVICSLTLR